MQTYEAVQDDMLQYPPLRIVSAVEGLFTLLKKFISVDSHHKSSFYDPANPDRPFAARTLELSSTEKSHRAMFFAHL